MSLSKLEKSVLEVASDGRCYREVGQALLWSSGLPRSKDNIKGVVRRIRKRIGRAGDTAAVLFDIAVDRGQYY